MAPSRQPGDAQGVVARHRLAGGGAARGGAVLMVRFCGAVERERVTRLPSGSAESCTLSGFNGNLGPEPPSSGCPLVVCTELTYEVFFLGDSLLQAIYHVSFGGLDWWFGFGVEALPEGHSLKLHP